MEFLTILLTFLLIFVTVYYLYRKANYFEKYGIPYIKPLPIFGNMAPLMFNLTSMAEHVLKYCNFCKEAKYIGFFDFLTPTIFVHDPELAKEIAIKHFDKFADHGKFADPDFDPFFGRNLFALQGDKWRKMRNLLTPTFTTSKMKDMCKLMSECAENFANYFVEISEKEATSVNAKDVFARYTTDVIATCAFGITTDSMRYPKNEFYIFGSKSCKFKGILVFKFFISRSLPMVAKLMRFKYINSKAERFFCEVIQETITTRKEKGIFRPDMLQLMMETKNDKTGQNLSIQEMTAQAFVFFFAGYDASSTMMSSVSYLISIHPEVQQKLHDEIDAVSEKCDGNPTFDMIQNMEYLEAVLYEALRILPNSAFLERVCTKDFELPPSVPGGKPYHLKAGHPVWLPFFGFQRDSAYFPEPEKFLPQRFLTISKSLTNNSPLFTPFGLGPRMCIARRFALLETKILFYHLLSKCILKPSKKMKVPLKFEKGLSFVPDGGYWFDIEPRYKK